MKRLLWVGDAGCDSGFARCTHRTLDVVSQHYDVTVLGLNYRGDPHNYPYPMYPAWTGGDFLGQGRVRELAERADIVVLQNDPWNIPGYLLQLKQLDVPIVGMIAVDSMNCRAKKFGLNGLTRALFWTDFGRDEAVAGGLTAPSSVIPLGVDLEIFSPGDREEARRAVGLPVDQVPPGAFIVGNINRNQPRKRLDLTIRYFAEWMKTHGHENDPVFLYLHVCPTGDQGIDCNQLAAYYGLQGHMILAEPGVWKGASIDHVVNTLRSFDVQINTALGEGWGLTTMEGMACGIPQIVPDWAALGDWPGPSVVKIPCEPTCFSSPTNQIGGVLDCEQTIDALEGFYKVRSLREQVGNLGRAWVGQDKFRWYDIGTAWLPELEQAFTDHGIRRTS